MLMMLQNSKVQNESRTFIKERVNNFIMDYEQH